MEVKAVLRIAYSNQKEFICSNYRDICHIKDYEVRIWFVDDSIPDP